MKTMIKNGVLKRVQDKNAQMLVNQGWSFVAKKVWKEQKAGGQAIHSEDAPQNTKKTKKTKRVKKAVEATVET